MCRIKCFLIGPGAHRSFSRRIVLTRPSRLLACTERRSKAARGRVGPEVSIVNEALLDNRGPPVMVPVRRQVFLQVDNDAFFNLSRRMVAGRSLALLWYIAPD